MVLSVEQLERWSLFGASWAVFELSDDQVTVDFLSCAGELVERGSSDDRDLIEYIRHRPPAGR